MPSITVRISDEMMDGISKQMEKYNRSMSEYIRILLVSSLVDDGVIAKPDISTEYLALSDDDRKLVDALVRRLA